MTEVLLIFDAEEIAERDGARFQLDVDPREFGELGAEFKLAVLHEPLPIKPLTV